MRERRKEKKEEKRLTILKNHIFSLIGTFIGCFTRVDYISGIFLLECLNVHIYFRHNKKIRVPGIAFYLHTSLFVLSRRCFG